METLVGLVDMLARETLLFSAVGFLIGGVDDLLIDLIWILRRFGERCAPPPRIETLPRSDAPHRLVIFIAAWREAAVIGAMLRTALAAIDYPAFRIYVGAYPNDPETIGAVETVVAGDPRVRLVVGPRDGPTTKADNLNVLWRALAVEDAAAGQRTDAIILHDAEDLIHADELWVHDALIGDFPIVQTPVVPLIDRAARMVSGHYADEFAESHGATLIVRAALGAGLPLAGVGCCVRVSALERLAEADGVPFDAASLTEDYELGLRLTGMGLRARFARVLGHDGSLVATRAFFPSAVDAAVRQKGRWMVGIALAGWDRVGWGRALDLREHWMRMRDRRAPLAMLVLAVAYLALVLWGVSHAAHWLLRTGTSPLGPYLRWLLTINAGLLVWRLAMRALHTGGTYGWREGLRAVPRLLVANFIALLAVRQALVRYVAVLRGAAQRWEKTEHVFPADPLDLPSR